MRRICLLLLIGMFAGINMSSAKSLVITLNDGTLVYYLLGDETNPMLRFTDGGFTIRADQYEFAGICNFYISSADDPNVIESLSCDDKVNFHDNMLVLKDVNVDQLKIYSENGTKCDADIRIMGNVWVIDMNSLPIGIYIINNGNISFKVAKK